MRLLELVFYLLRSSSKVTINELAREFDVSTKTIRRDLDKLSVIGIPIITHRGVNGGVEIDKNYVISKHILREHDYESLLLALYIGENISENISKYLLIDKFKSINHNRCSEILNNLEERFIVDLYEEKFDLESEVCQTINKCMDKKLFVELKVNEKKYEVYPISYALRKEGLCLYCYNDKYMIIQIDKISEARVSNKSYDGSIISYDDNKMNAEVI